jgi:hypothetical protein
VLTSANTAGLDLDQHIVVAELFLMSVLVLVPREKDLFTFGRGTVTTPYSSGLVYLHGRVSLSAFLLWAALSIEICELPEAVFSIP